MLRVLRAGGCRLRRPGGLRGRGGRIAIDDVLFFLEDRLAVRTIEAMELHGSVIEAWCRLREDDRAFALNRITSVFEPD